MLRRRGMVIVMEMVMVMVMVMGLPLLALVVLVAMTVVIHTQASRRMELPTSTLPTALGSAVAGRSNRRLALLAIVRLIGIVMMIVATTRAVSTLIPRAGSSCVASCHSAIVATPAAEKAEKAAKGMGMVTGEAAEAEAEMEAKLATSATSETARLRLQATSTLLCIKSAKSACSRSSSLAHRCRTPRPWPMHAATRDCGGRSRCSTNAAGASATRSVASHMAPNEIAREAWSLRQDCSGRRARFRVRCARLCALRCLMCSRASRKATLTGARPCSCLPFLESMRRCSRAWPSHLNYNSTTCRPCSGRARRP
mmetsp:Transcript_32692/g.68842  ORF Transcript_32692/g.68842 Transcript_32692/m.68842 type:complete len:312 (+) Transcript_32692:288-1223(+)